MIPRYLMHHGIQGQKWGKTNGPPYPLGEERRSVDERLASDPYTARKIQKIRNKAAILRAKNELAEEKTRAKIMGDVDNYLKYLSSTQYNDRNKTNDSRLESYKKDGYTFMQGVKDVKTVADSANSVVNLASNSLKTADKIASKIDH